MIAKNVRRFAFNPRKERRCFCPTCGSKKHKKLFSVPSISAEHHSTQDFSSCSNDIGGYCGGGACGIN
ncbi:MAG: hypothetical protein KGZ58_10245 [Ignavibacteriales bacterium]|nr:hypothetical protein [Ignavibacteriales bacterium]